MFTFIQQLVQDPLGKIPAPTNKIIGSGNANTNIANLITVFLSTATVLGGLVFMIMLVLGGIKWLTAGGDKAALESAKNQITNATIGLAIIVAAVAITVVIQTAFGINILRPNLGG